MNEWRVLRRRSVWPVCINRPKDKDCTPIWVWGDRKLGSLLVRLLNENNKNIRLSKDIYEKKP